MSQGEPKTTGGPPPGPRIDAQVAELRESEARYPPPTWEEVKPERRWIDGMLANETPGDDWPYWNRYVAVYQQRIVGAGRDPLQPQIDMAREFGVHPERIVVTYVGQYVGPWYGDECQPFA